MAFARIKACKNGRVQAMAEQINIRAGRSADWDGLANVFHRAVSEGAGHYTAEQRAVWSPASKAGPDWSVRMERQSVMLAETGQDGPVGFLTCELNGYFDCAYILKSHQGHGLFSKLYAPLEAEHRARSLKRLHVHASLHAQPAFAAKGFTIVRPETVKMATVWMPRFLMEKQL